MILALNQYLVFVTALSVYDFVAIDNYIIFVSPIWPNASLHVQRR